MMAYLKSLQPSGNFDLNSPNKESPEGTPKKLSDEELEEFEDNPDVWDIVFETVEFVEENPVDLWRAKDKQRISIMEVFEEKDFYANNFWKLPPKFTLDDLIEDMSN